MQGIVESVKKDKDGVCYVTMKTPYGTLAGAWDGSPPAPASTVHVELDFDLESVDQSDQSSYLVSSAMPGKLTMRGISELWMDGVLDVRVGTSLVQVELEAPIEPGNWLLVQGRDLKLYDTNP
jgi:hypothetical protein